MAAKLFLLATRGRSGSHMLQTALQQHPQLQCHGELFNPKQTPDKRRWARGTLPAVYVQRLLTEAPEGIRRVGFIGHYQQVRRDTRILPALRQAKPHVIILYRKNMLAQYVSHVIARRTRRWTTTAPAPTTQKVIVTPAGAFGYFRENRRWIEDDKRAWRQYPQLVVTYEDLLQHWDDVMQRIFAFLEVPPQPVAPVTCRQEHRRLSEIITNYADLSRALRRTEFARFLKEDP
jgi:LPS sulfotransferase NodH